MGGVRFVDEVGVAFGWIAPQPGFMQRASHAVASHGRVWVIDPVADASALARARELGEPAGVVQLLDRHGRDCRAVAWQLGVGVRLARKRFLQDVKDLGRLRHHPDRRADTSMTARPRPRDG